MKHLNISVVLPIESSKHKNFSELFNGCVSSVQNQIKKSVRGEDVIGDIELVIVHSGEESLVETINSIDFSGLTTNNS